MTAEAFTQENKYVAVSVYSETGPLESVKPLGLSTKLHIRFAAICL
jgi:hypothetical protein